MILQLSDPITQDGGISAGWILVVCFAVIGSLLVIIMQNINKSNKDAMNTFKDEIKSIHKRIDTRESEHDELKNEHSDLTTRVLLMEATNKMHENTAEKTAHLILDKLGALGGETGKHKKYI